MSTRERCKDCGRYSPLGFHVPDEVWAAVAPPGMNVLCIVCFDYHATENGIDWVPHVSEWAPVSGVMHARVRAGRSGRERAGGLDVNEVAERIVADCDEKAGLQQRIATLESEREDTRQRLLEIRESPLQVPATIRLLADFALNALDGKGQG